MQWNLGSVHHMEYSWEPIGRLHLRLEFALTSHLRLIKIFVRPREIKLQVHTIFAILLPLRVLLYDAMIVIR